MKSRDWSIQVYFEDDSWIAYLYENGNGIDRERLDVDSNIPDLTIALVIEARRVFGIWPVWIEDRLVLPAPPEDEEASA